MAIVPHTWASSTLRDTGHFPSLSSALKFLFYSPSSKFHSPDCASFSPINGPYFQLKLFVSLLSASEAGDSKTFWFQTHCSFQPKLTRLLYRLCGLPEYPFIILSKDLTLG
jgi:hypothetical protein